MDSFLFFLSDFLVFDDMIMTFFMVSFYLFLPAQCPLLLLILNVDVLQDSTSCPSSFLPCILFLRSLIQTYGFNQTNIPRLFISNPELSPELQNSVSKWILLGTSN